MIIERLNAGNLMERFEEKGIEALSGIVRSVTDSLKDVDIDALEAHIAQGIVPSARRFGKGAALLGPYGYFHPSIIGDVADNTSRGRLLKKGEGSLYTYDFYASGEIAAIEFPSMACRTLCEKDGDISAYLTYEARANAPREINSITLIRHGGSRVEAMLEMGLIGRMMRLGHISVETYETREDGERICNWLYVGPTEESFKVYQCLKMPLRVIYDDRGKIVGCESLPTEEVGLIEL